MPGDAGGDDPANVDAGGLEAAGLFGGTDVSAVALAV